MPATLDSQTHPSKIDVERALDCLMPLVFYFGSLEALPPLKFIVGSTMPEPYRYLLVHSSDMTPRLHTFHKDTIGLRVHHKEESEDYIMRMVVLDREGDGRPVEFGAIGIRLETFSPWVKREIRECLSPLGAILERERVPHSSHPRAFFQITADSLIARLLDCEAGTVLYGRCNELRDADGVVFADIVEILPPDRK